MNKGHGFQEAVILPENYQYGGGNVPDDILQPDGNWRAFLPPFEAQSVTGLETYNCTSYGTLNALETLLKRKFGIDADYSERYMGIMAENTPTGNNPFKVAETIRKVAGNLNESLLPFKNINNWNDYYSPKPMDNNLLILGQAWWNSYDFLYEWVIQGNETNKADKLKSALQHSPLGIAVQAWNVDENGYYYFIEGNGYNHWVELFGYEDGKYWLVHDSYDQDVKRLKWDYNFGQAMRYFVSKATIPNEPSTSLLESLIRILTGKVPQALINFIISFLKQPMPQPKTNMIGDWAEAIKTHEGWYPGSRSFRNHNPGNLRYVGQPLAKGQDAQGFCKFATDADGMTTLQNMLINACSGKSKVYNPEMSLLDFFKLFAPSFDNNNPKVYAETVAKKLGVTTDIKIKQLLG